jgi:isopentenyl phosphate kinase
MPTLFLKLGGSAITDKTREATTRPETIRSAAQAVRAALDRSPGLSLLLGHGSGSFGHYAALKSGFGQPGNWRAYAETGAAAARLNRLVADIFLEVGVPVVSIQPSASALCRDGEVVSLSVDPIITALHHGLVPLIYGDVAFDATREMTIVSTDMLFEFLAPVLQPERIIHVTAVGGIYTADPQRDPSAELVPEITPLTFPSLRARVGAAHGVDVTGGMLDKLNRSLDLVTRFPALHIFVVDSTPAALLSALLDPDPLGGTHIHYANR